MTTWAHDRCGQVTNKLDQASAQILRYQYNAGGRLTNRWSAAKGNTAYRYDQAGSLTNVIYAVSPQLRYQYDAANRVTNMIDGVGKSKGTPAFDVCVELAPRQPVNHAGSRPGSGHA